MTRNYVEGVRKRTHSCNPECHTCKQRRRQRRLVPPPVYSWAARCLQFLKAQRGYKLNATSVHAEDKGTRNVPVSILMFLGSGADVR